jgi:hypothetical protein
MLTAAHCDVNGPDPTNWYDGPGTSGNGTYIGTTCSLPCAPYHIGGYLDAEKVNGAGQTGSPFNRVYYDDSDKNYPITGMRSQSGQHNGDYVDLTGIKSNTHYNQTIANVSANYSYNWDGCGGCVVSFQGVRVHTGSNSLVKGDSGGPDYFAGYAMGMNSATGGGDSYYVFIDQNVNALNVSICMSDAC